MVNRLTATKNSFEDERFENLLFKTAVKLIPNIYWDFDAFGQVLEDVNSTIKKSTNKENITSNACIDIKFCQR